MRHHTRLLVPCFVLLAGCGDSTGDDPDGVTRTERFAWSGEIAPAGTVEIRNINGAVSARPGAGSTVEVRALKEGRSDDPATVRIVVVETPGRVTICALYPDVPGQPANACLPGPGGQLSSRSNDVSVTFEVDVPPGRTFAAGTIAGAVEAADLTGFVEARSVAGDIVISTTAAATAATVNGDIAASIGSPNWDRDLSFSTTNGDVTVRIPALADADIWCSTARGSITTDFSLGFTQFGDWQQLRGTLGDGGFMLRITTVRGNIALLANPRTASSTGEYP